MHIVIGEWGMMLTPKYHIIISIMEKTEAGL